MLIEKYELKRVPGACDDDGKSVSIQATLPKDVSAIFPYVNASLPGCSYNHAGKVLNWGEGRHKIVLRPQELAISNLPSWEQAQAALARLADFLNETWERRDTLTPREEAYPQPHPLAVYKQLPNTNCRACGRPTCYTFALKLITREMVLDDCPVLAELDWAEQKDGLRAMLWPPPEVLFDGR